MIYIITLSTRRHSEGVTVEADDPITALRAAMEETDNDYWSDIERIDIEEQDTNYDFNPIGAQ